TQQLDSLGDRLMFRLSYRRFATYESLIVNHSVQVRSTSTQVGPRWYEIRNPFGTPAVAQQSTFAPDTTRYRWMGAVAQDKQGNLLLGYSASSASLFPSIGYAGRLATDPVNQLSASSCRSSAPARRPATRAGATTPAWPSIPWTTARSGSSASISSRPARSTGTPGWRA